MNKRERKTPVFFFPEKQKKFHAGLSLGSRSVKKSPQQWSNLYLLKFYLIQSQRKNN